MKCIFFFFSATIDPNNRFIIPELYIRRVVKITPHIYTCIKKHHFDEGDSVNIEIGLLHSKHKKENKISQVLIGEISLRDKRKYPKNYSVIAPKNTLNHAIFN